MRYLAKDEHREGFDVLTYFKNREYWDNSLSELEAYLVERGKLICFDAEVDIIKNGMFLDEQYRLHNVYKFGHENDFFTKGPYEDMVKVALDEAKQVIKELSKES